MASSPAGVVVDSDLIEAYGEMEDVPTAREAAERPPPKTPNDEREDALYGACRICFQYPSSSDEVLLLCDDCDRGYHPQCLRPPLTRVPPGEWMCFNCSAKHRNARLSRAAAVAAMRTSLKALELVTSFPPRMLLKFIPRDKKCRLGKFGDGEGLPRPFSLPLADPILPAKLTAKLAWADGQHDDAIRISRRHDRSVHYWLANRRLDGEKSIRPSGSCVSGRVQKVRSR